MVKYIDGKILHIHFRIESSVLISSGQYRDKNNKVHTFQITDINKICEICESIFFFAKFCYDIQHFFNKNITVVYISRIKLFSDTLSQIKRPTKEMVDLHEALWKL